MNTQILHIIIPNKTRVTVFINHLSVIKLNELKNYLAIRTVDGCTIRIPCKSALKLYQRFNEKITNMLKHGWECECFFVDPEMSSEINT